MIATRLVALFSCCLLTLQCSTGRKVTYDIPADFPAERRLQVISLFEKGKVLYKAHCAACHGIFTKGKDNVPNFTEAQFDNYSARFLRGDPQNHAITRKMSAEQLNQVLMFLRYKKRYGAKATAIPADTVNAAAAMQPR